MITHLIFDFFGTLVQYSSSLFSGTPFQQTYQLLHEQNVAVSYEQFTQDFSQVFQAFERRSKQTANEFHMHDVITALFQETYSIQLDPDYLHRFTETYLDEWNRGTVFLPGIQEFIADLSTRYTLSVLSNTHYPDLIHRNLKSMGIQAYFPQVITSIEFGKRKPHFSIFQEALDGLAISPSQALYIGDTYEDDYLGARQAHLRAILIDPRRAYLNAVSDRVDALFEIQNFLMKAEASHSERQKFPIRQKENHPIATH